MEETSPYLSFMAEDALAYADAYRKALSWPQNKIAEQMDWLRDQVNGEEQLASTVYAEYRGYQDALRWVVREEAPDFVYLGRDSEREEARKQANGQNQAMLRAEELEAQMVEMRDEVKRLRREKGDIDSLVAGYKNQVKSATTKLNNCIGMQYILMATTGGFFVLAMVLAFL